MKLFKYKKFILIGIIILAFALRFYRLNVYPALNADEASWGYDAYSLIQTGKDQHGNAWPIDFQSFNDYKPGLYGYMVLPFVKVLGLNEWSVRLPNAILSVASVYLIYLLVKELFGKDKEFLALTSAFFLSISPWHIQFSRGGWEANSATFLITLGILFFLKYFNENSKKVWQLVLGILSLILSVYCYQATRVIAPLIGLSLLIIYRKEIFKNIHHTVIAVSIGTILLVPLLIDFSKGNVLSRAAGVGLFADPGPRARVEEQRGNYSNPNSKIAILLHNKVVNYTLAFAANWASHFHGEFLFLSGDAVTRNKVPETGEMYLTDIIFLSIGLIVLIRKKIEKNNLILITWIIIAPIASSLTFQSPSALRAENLVTPLIIISALGFTKSVDLVRKVKLINLKNFIYLFLGFVIIWGVGRYLQMYYFHMSKEYPYSSQYGVKELVDSVEKNQDKYKKILVTDRYDQPYILFLFYMKYPPAKFQSEHTLTPRDSFGYSTVNHFDKYYFTSIKFEEAKVDNPNSLIAGTNEEIPKEANIIKNVYGTNGFLYFKIVAN